MTDFRKLVLGIGLVILLVFGLLGGYTYLHQRKEVQLYLRAFRLLKERLVAYIKGHYPGLSHEMTLFRKIMLGIGLVILLVVGLVGGHIYMEQRKEVQLYQRGFRLLEEQLGVYIKEHYSGVSKVEFTDISGYRYYAMEVHPIITDNYGNRTYLDESINGAYGTSTGIRSLGEDGFGEPSITLMDYDKNREIDVSKDKTLPAKAKLETYESMDKKIQVLIQEGKLKGVQKSDKGSPGMKIVYNLKVTIKD